MASVHVFVELSRSRKGETDILEPQAGERRGEIVQETGRKLKVPLPSERVFPHSCPFKGWPSKHGSRISV